MANKFQPAVRLEMQRTIGAGGDLVAVALAIVCADKRRCPVSGAASCEKESMAGWR